MGVITSMDSRRPYPIPPIATLTVSLYGGAVVVVGVVVVVVVGVVGVVGVVVVVVVVLVIDVVEAVTNSSLQHSSLSRWQSSTHFC